MLPTQGDSSNAASTSAALSVPVVAAPGLAATTTTISFTNPVNTSQFTTYTATVTGQGANKPTGTVRFFFGANTFPSSPIPLNSSTGIASMGNAFAFAGTYAITAAYSGDTNNQGSASVPVGQQVNNVAAQPSLGFVPVTPCRIADTRSSTGPFGGPPIGGGQTRNFAIPQSAWGIPATAAAYSLNVTVVPSGQLTYLNSLADRPADSQRVAVELHRWPNQSERCHSARGNIRIDQRFLRLYPNLNRRHCRHQRILRTVLTKCIGAGVLPAPAMPRLWILEALQAH